MSADDKHSSLRVRMAVLHTLLVNAINGIWEVLQLPFRFAAFFIYILLFIAAPIWSICVYGIYGFAALLGGLVPILYLIMRESRRKDRIPPASDRYEISPEQWNETLDDFTANAGDETD